MWLAALATYKLVGTPGAIDAPGGRRCHAAHDGRSGRAAGGRTRTQPRTRRRPAAAGALVRNARPPGRRSGERRGGNECVRSGRYRWAEVQSKNKKDENVQK